MLTADQNEEGKPWFTTMQVLDNQVIDLRHYLAIENAKIVEAELQKIKLMNKISQCRRQICKIEKTL